MTPKQVDAYIQKHWKDKLDDELSVDITAIGYRISMEAVSARRRRMGLKRPISNATINAFKKDLLKDGFDGQNWSHGWLKNKGTSVFIKNKDGFITYDQIREELVKEIKRYAPKYPKIKRVKVSDGHLLVIDPADIHLGKLARTEETAQEYTIEIAVKRCLDGVNGLISKAQGFNVEKILLVIGNDILHRDNPQNTTTAGTRMDVDGMWWEAFIEAKKLYVKVIENLLTIADVDVVYCPSNHDYQSGFMLADSLSSWFHNNQNVTFNCSILHRKYVQYGLNMLVFDHGDGSKERDTKDLMADEQPRMWADTKFRYAYKHHLHHKRKLNWISGKDYIGITVEYLRSPTAEDSWHNRNGYHSMKAVEAFVHHRNNGQVARLTHYF